ncbi:hypothetical protein V1477_005488 [Vespula maculifrons]|uniref:Uncharacterized protein n=1 Tax=Vespula maculifrons TaxID=7453 RepID=A0ABD2CPS3_VESMC
MEKVGTGSLGRPLLKTRVRKEGKRRGEGEEQEEGEGEGEGDGDGRPLSSTLRATAELAILFKPVDNGSTVQISWDLNRRNNRREQGQRCWLGEK